MGFLKEGEKMKLVAPKLSYIEKTSFEECLKKMKFQDVHIDQNIQQRTIIQDLTFDGCFFENIDFTKVSLKHLDLIDVTFDKCDLSNQNFDHQYLNRVQFKNCKLTGTCQGRYSNLSSSQLLNVMFDHCDLQEASFYDANFKKIQFNETNLIQSELASLHHKGLDLSTCQIQGAMFDLASLKGLIINDFQAVDLIGILGVKVK